MCGIAGLIGLEGSNSQISNIIRGIQSSLHHRGPNNKGSWSSIKYKISFIHTRLSILDLSESGNQPMHSSCGRYIITFNGEIYNHLKLREFLKTYKKNIQWKGSSDTETLVESFSIIGIDKTLELLRGMFAFSVFDRKTKKIYLVRDRYGEKPLYLLSLKNGIFAFSSEVSSFSYIPDFSPNLDYRAVSCYFQRGYIAAPFSIWHNVKKIMPGSKMTLSLSNTGKYFISSEEEYWSVEKIAIDGQKNLYKNSYNNCKNELEEILLEVLKGQSLSDVPLGVFLSGGIDSSIVAALMQKISSHKVKTFSIGFTNRMYDESHYAEAVAKHLNTEHITLIAKPSDAINLIEEMPKVYSEPFADSSQIPTTLLAKLVKEHVTVALSGDGGDEVFSGYSRYIFANKTYNLLTRGPIFIRKLLCNLIYNLPPDKLNNIGQLIKINRLGDKIYKASNIMLSENLENYYNELITYWPRKTLVASDSIFKYHFSKNLGSIENMMLADQLNYLPNDILVKVDRAAMSSSLETRSPLLDHILSEFVWSTPTEWRVDKNGGKRILRDILYDYVPKNLIDRPKQGFGLPVNEWLRGPLKDWAMNLFDQKNLPGDGFLDGNLARETLEEHLQGKRNWDYRLWPILMWQQWYQSKGII
ncbi:MAG: asparagine synthase (glutamine-hydrolyzing) [Rickettsiales bacterium]|nr:asparagine synthase (glutamine-hydrolyzing) [Rickettsiales bacterium]